MNRTGLLVALGLFAAIAIIFGVWPDLDLKLAALFYDPETRRFPTTSLPYAQFARDAAMWIAWAFVAPSILALIVKLIWPNRPLLVKGRTMAFLILTMLMSAGVLTNFTFKTFWSRPRPVMVTEFNGPWEFKAWWDPTGQCGRNCSFFSGEGATAVLDLCSGRARAALGAALRLCGGDGVRNRHLGLADGFRRPFLYRRDHRRPRVVPGYLVDSRMDLPLALDPDDG